MAFEEKEKFTGILKETGQSVRFNRMWSSHRFTDEECELLLAGESLEFPMTSKKGNPYTARGRLMEQTYEGHKFWGFQLCDDVLPSSLRGHAFTEKEKEDLKEGLWVEAEDFVSSKSGKAYHAKVCWKDKEGGGKEFRWSFPSEWK